MGFRIGIVLIGIMFLLAGKTSLAEPSFDCRKASNAVDFTICADSALSQLDLEMATLFSTLRNNLDETRAARLIGSQRQWLRQRSKCKANTICLTRRFNERIAELQAFEGLQETVSISCPEAIAEARTFSAGIEFQVDVPAPLSPSTELRLTYRVSATRSPIPLYIVVDLPPESRFRGKGFLPLTAGAKGPNGLAHASERTRAIIPVDASQSATTGVISAFLLSAGPQYIGFSLVTGGRCGEHVLHTQRSVTLKVDLGLPEIVIQDGFKTDRPKTVTSDVSGRLIMRVYPGRYEILDKASGDLLISRSGLEPKFSPTGRFVAAMRATDTQIEVVDLASGSVIGEFSDGVLAWARNDSFIVGGATVRKTLNTIVSSLNPDMAISTEMPNMEVAWRDEEIVLDVDRMFIAMTTTRGGLFWDLISGNQLPLDNVDGRTALRQLVRQQRGLDLPLTYPLWKFGEPIQVTHADYFYTANHPDMPHLQNFTLIGERDKINRLPDTVASASAAECAKSGGGRGLARVKGNPICATEVTGRGLGRLPRPRAQAPEAVIFDRIAAVIGAITSAEPIKQQSFGPWDESTDRKLKVDSLVKNVGRLTPAFSAGISPLSLQDRLVNCKTRAGGFDPNYIDRSWHWTNEGDGVAALFIDCTVGSAFLRNSSLLLVSKYGVQDIKRQLLPDVERDVLTEEELQAYGVFGWSESDDSGIHIFSVGDGRILVSASYSGQAAIIETRSGKRLGNLFPLADPTLVRAMRLTVDGRHLVQLNHDGRFAVFRASDGGQILIGAHVDDEVVVMLPDGRFDTTYEGAHSLNVRFAGLAALQTVHQFGAALHRPGLAKAVLEGREVEPRPGSLGSPPVVDFAASLGEDGKRQLAVSATDDTMLAKLRVFIDGRLIEEHPIDGNSSQHTFEIEDPGGGHWITVVALDGQGLTSAPKAILLPPPAITRGVLRAVIVGIDVYDTDPVIPPLSFARSDAERLRAVLQSTGNGSPANAELTVLLDVAATRTAILDALKEAVAATKADDTLVFSFAGHGVGSGEEGITGDLLLALSTTRADALSQTGLSWRDVAAELAHAEGKVVILLDACHAGLAGSSAFTTNDDATGALLTSAGAPMVVLAASKGRQVALEDGKRGGGLFTSAIVDTLSTGRSHADIDANGVVDLGEFYAAVKSRVLSDTEGRQSPWLARNLLVGDMALF